MVLSRASDSWRDLGNPPSDSKQISSWNGLSFLYIALFANSCSDHCTMRDLIRDLASP